MPVIRLEALIRYESPLGPLGWLADWLFLDRYMTEQLAARVAGLKALAEARGPAAGGGPAGP